MDVVKLDEPCKFLCVSYLILYYPLPFILLGLHASIQSCSTKQAKNKTILL